jgi:hypothetical protein
MRRQIVAGALAAVSLLGMAAPALAQDHSCFFITQWRGWKAADDHTVYIHVDPNRIYRLDMSGSCPALLDSTSHLITNNHTSSICSALDWDLRISEGQGFVTGCIVGKMTKLTPDQAAALPPKLRP